MDQDLLLSTSDMATSLLDSIPHTYEDYNSSSARAGLRQTDLSHQLEINNKKRHRLKTQSILYNGKMNNSKMSLTDQQSVHSGGTSGYGGYNNNPSTDNLQYQQQYQQQHQQHQYQQQYQQKQYQQQQIIPQQQYNNYGVVQQQQQQQQQQFHWNNQQHAIHSQPLPKQKGKYRESYMYFDESLEEDPGQLKRRFSSHGVIGSPMSTPSDDLQHSKLSYATSVIGIPIAPNNNNNSQRSVEYMNSLDGDDNNWVDTDGSDIDQNDNGKINTKIKNTNGILQLENRSLKKKLKDMEIKYETITPDEKVVNTNKYQKEIDNLNDENSSISRTLAKTKMELLKSNDKLKELSTFSNELIKRLPNYIPNRDVCVDLVSGVPLPSDFKNTFESSLNLYETKTKETEKHIEGTLTDDDLMKLLRSDIKILLSTVQRLTLEKKQMERLYSKRLNEERRTIRMAAKHKTVHSEFQKSSNYKPDLLKGFKLIMPVLISDGQNLKSAQSTPALIQDNRISTTSSSSIDEWSDAIEENNPDQMELSAMEDINTTITEDQFKIKPKISDDILSSNAFDKSIDSPKSLVFETFTS